ncbi:hypothetical protein GCM10010273_01520 [Streptomyces lavendulocolor]
MPPPNMSERPPPFPLCISTSSISSALKTMRAIENPITTAGPYFLAILGLHGLSDVYGRRGPRLRMKSLGPRKGTTIPPYRILTPIGSPTGRSKPVPTSDRARSLVPRDLRAFSFSARAGPRRLTGRGTGRS